MSNAKLLIEWEEFSAAAEERIRVAQRIAEKERQIRTFEDLEVIKAEIKVWYDDCLSFLRGSFDVENNKYAVDFRNARPHRFNVAQSEKHISQTIKEEFENLKAKQIDLWGTERILSACDFIINKNLHLFAARQKYSTAEKMDLLLDKLYDLFDQNSYPIKDILIGNGIILATPDEGRDLAVYLEQSGFIEHTNGPGGISGQLTTSGRLYVENKRKAYQENYNDINSSAQEMNEKIDSVILELKKLGLGQEIIYDEIEELKELYINLSKKHWTQTLKGKLVDIGLAQALDKDVLKEIFEQLTNHQFRLLS